MPKKQPVRTCAPVFGTARRNRETRKSSEKVARAHARARDPDMKQRENAPKSQILNGTAKQPNGNHPRLRNGRLYRATALRMNWHKHWTGDQLSEKVGTGRRRHERLLEA